MLLNSADIRYALEKAKEITNRYKQHSQHDDAKKRSIDTLIAVCTEQVKKEIYFRESRIPAKGRSVKGYYKHINNHYEVFLLRGMNTCWKRIVTCKELFHVVLDKQDFRSINLYPLVVEAVTKFPGDEFGSSALVSEEIAEIAAMEFMFPYRKRLIELEAEVPNSLEIAESYRIPQFMVEKYLEAPYMKNLGAFMLDPQ